MVLRTLLKEAPLRFRSLWCFFPLGLGLRTDARVGDSHFVSGAWITGLK